MTITSITLRNTPTIDTATAATLTISQDKVREINDPIQEMLHQLHKIIYISQVFMIIIHDYL